MSEICFRNLPNEIQLLVIDVVKRKLERLNCDVQIKKFQKVDHQFSLGVVAEQIERDQVFELPKWVTLLCDMIVSHSQCEGLFRKNAADSKLQKLKGNMLHLTSLEISGIEAAALLKMCLRDMEPNLFSNAFTKLLIYIWQTFAKNAMRESLVLEAILLLPLPYLVLCGRLFSAFNSVTKKSLINKMDAKNVAICVSMSLFTLENTKVITASALNEIVEFLIENHRKIGTLTTDLHSLTIKSVERKSFSSGKKIPFSEKLRKKATGKIRKPGHETPRNSGRELCETPRGSSRQTWMETESHGNEPKVGKSTLSVLSEPSSANRSPSFTSGMLKNGPKKSGKGCVRRASISMPDKSEMPRSVSSVRKKRVKIDSSASSSLNEEVDDNSYNLSKLNFVTFDSPPGNSFGVESDADDSPSENKSNTPLILNAASAARATRRRLEMMNVSKRCKAEVLCNMDCQTNDLNMSFTEVEVSRSKNCVKPVDHIIYNANEAEDEHAVVEDCGNLDRTRSAAKQPVKRSALCIIEEDDLAQQRGEESTWQPAKNSSFSEEFANIQAADLEQGTCQDFLTTEEERRLSFCLVSESHKNNFRSLKELWEQN